jgi:DEAD/DEAH box helicase domain-containing protein
MNPSVLAQQLQQAVSDYLRVSFETTSPFFEGMLERFIDKPGQLAKGPYLSIKLPFEKGSGKSDFFPDVPLKFPPHKHQEIAFSRIGLESKSTLVATGTGSGKTECFQIPILNYCYQNRHKPGIKAIFIYPMNALATDQAERLAGAIYNNSSLKGKITAGIYVGDQESAPCTFMEEKRLISDKETLRNNPPDILLTNYKMLDFLMIRAKDYPLWSKNTEETLKFLVVDELHTFDGAQGTDLACLIRRLKARLDMPKQHLVCVGTSATLGGQDAGQNLISYATAVFDEHFDDQSVITEYRQSLGDYLASSPVEHIRFPSPDQFSALQVENYPDLESYGKAQAQLWFDTLQLIDHEDLWRVELSRALKKHFLFQNLLRLLNGQIADWQDLLQQFKRGLGIQVEASDEFVEQLLGSLVALISIARNDGFLQAEDDTKAIDRLRELATQATPIKLNPLLDVRMQLWLRELRRLYVLLPTQDEQPQLLFADDGKVPQDRIALPAIHCRDCGAMGMLTHKADDQQRVSTDLDLIYRAFFERSAKSCLLFPMDKVDVPWNFPDSLDRHICACCGFLNRRSQKSCQNCGSEDLLWVHVPDNNKVEKNKHTGESNNKSHNDCPFCQSRGSLLIVGARSTSLSSVMVGQLSASPFNKDKQLIAFSDAVQDTAHRAGYIGARTRSFGFRVAVKRVIDQSPEPVSLTQLIDRFNQFWLAELGDAAFIGTFLPTDMEWLRDFSALKKDGHLPVGSNLLKLLQRRMAFEILSEVGFRSRIGRSLERSSAAACYFDAEVLQGAILNLLITLQETVGPLKQLERDELDRFVRGLLTYLRVAGGVYSPELEGYIKESGNAGVFIRQLHLPNFAPNARVPTFLGTKKTKGLDTLVGTQNTGASWYQTWLQKNLFRDELLQQSGDMDAAIYHAVLKQLLKSQILVELMTGTGETVWAINPDILLVGGSSTKLRCSRCHHSQHVAVGEAAIWTGALCLRKNCLGHYQVDHNHNSASDFYGRLYRDGEVNRVVAAEHTGLLSRDERAEVEFSFKKKPADRQPWDINLLSATPTLEMGVDIGDLSSVLLCSVPPAQANYLQRIGRAGRRDGNAINVTLANADAHDLYFYSDPKEMMAGEVESPGVFLDASAVLERQYTAFCLDQWVKKYADQAVIPLQLKTVLSSVAKTEKDLNRFPYSFLNFVEIHRTLLLDQFLELFNSAYGVKLSAFSEERIKQFAEGDFSNQGSLSFRIHERLLQQQLELDSLNKEAKRVNTVMQNLKKTDVLSPQDEENLEQLETELSALQTLVIRINAKDTLQFFTDEGLIPNYAFPEQGVLLRSVIYRSKKDNEASVKAAGVSAESERWMYEYERPAAAALSELAPLNTFYAGGRRVQITRIDMRVSKKENWRLCRSCHHSECIDAGDHYKSCPRCGDAWWTNVSQKQTMLRLKQVYANTADRKSRISDDRDDRDSQFFTRQLLIDFAPQVITAAWKVDKEDWPFGFEFISRADFREINTGNSDENSPEITIAGQDTKRKGFKVCQFCGMVQAGNGQNKEQMHTISCTARSKDNEGNLISGLFLYREFHSEAIRILLPITSGSEAEIIENSFVAALHLGLKKKFGGSIDHLRVAQNIEPDSETGISKRYLVIYDAIPGGTGYLKQLMTNQQALMDVLTEFAMPVLENCSCVQKEGADGCYRCLYVYRNSRNLNTISRRKARDFIQTLKDHEGKIVSVAGLKDVKISPLIESELEARFLEALRRIGKERDVELRPEFHGGHAGWYARFGDQRYFLQPQVELDRAQGIAVPSRADFVFWPLGLSTAKPIVVFTDGFQYHKERVAVDTAQRMAIVAAGGFWAWSLTYDDVQNILDNKESQHLGLALGMPNDNVKTLSGRFKCESLLSLQDKSSFSWLIHLLIDPKQSEWANFTAMVGFIWSQKAGKDSLEISLPEFAQQNLAGLAASSITKFIENGSDFGEAYQRIQVALTLDKAAIQQGKLDQLSTIIVFNDESALDESELDIKQWQALLRFMNLFQFQPLNGFFTAKGIAEHIYDGIKVSPPVSAAAPSNWELLLADAIGSECDIINKLIDTGVPVPLLGFELENDMGEIVGEAFLAWIDQKVAMIFDNYENDKAIFKKAGWQAFLVSDFEQDTQSLIQALV